MPRFVVLRHDTTDDSPRGNLSHFDWMFDVGDSLRTFASTIIESFETPFEIEAESIADHRLEYLDFQGELTDHRGHVQPVIWGNYQNLCHDIDRWEMRLAWQDEQQSGVANVTLQHQHDGQRTDSRIGLRWSLRWDRCR